MGQFLSCNISPEHNRFLQAIQEGDVDHIKNAVQENPCLLDNARYFRHRLSPLHLAASKGRNEVLATLLDCGARVDVLDRHGKTPLMLACKNNKWVCAKQLLDNGANVLVSKGGNNCLHYAAKGGNNACVQKMLVWASSSDLCDVAEFVNMYDKNGLTALHWASLTGHATIVGQLLNHGANVSAVSLACSQYTGLGGGRSPLHFAARGGSLDCVKELLSWGADRFQRDYESCTAYGLAVAYRNFACAGILDPNTAEPLLWPSPLKFMNELEPEAKCLLEAALIKANEEQRRRKQNKRMDESQELSQSLSQELGGSQSEVCSICFERSCTIQIGGCAHIMCATCVLKLCCLRSRISRQPTCPFCRCQICHISIVRSHGTGNINESPRCKPNGKRFKRKSSSGRISALPSEN